MIHWFYEYAKNIWKTEISPIQTSSFAWYMYFNTILAAYKDQKARIIISEMSKTP